jgi:MFS family permease
VQWKSGATAWLGWMFDGLDMHLYTLVATPFVAELLSVDTKHPDVGRYGSSIQAAFLVGWTLGGTLFGRLGDRLGRSRRSCSRSSRTPRSRASRTWRRPGGN